MLRRAVLLTLALLAISADATIPQVPGPPHPADRYVLGLLRRGPGYTPTRTAATDSIQAGHLANIGRMAEEGVLLAAGPFLDRGDLRGVYIFRYDSLAKIRRMTARDPAIQSTRLVLDLGILSAPANIGTHYFSRWKQPGFRDSMITMQLVLLKRGPKADEPRSAATDSIQRKYMFGLLRTGQVALAGPLDSASDLVGLYVFRGDSATVVSLMSEDPNVRAGRLVFERHPWMAAYGTMPGDTL